jgi:hypothetical protein
MSDGQQNTEPEMDEWEKAQQAAKDAETRRAVQIQIDETEKHAAAKRTKNLGELSDDELRRLTRKWGYEAI